MATTIVTKYGSDAPAASDIVRGELAVDTENGRLYTENSSAAVVELGSNPSGNITFGDNGKAIFGAGSDLQIYHDGNHSYIEDSGTGAIKIKVGDFRVENASGNNLIKGVGDVATLHHAGAQKLATTSTGIDVTGTVDTSLDLLAGGAVKGNSGTRSLNVGTAGSVSGGVQMWASDTQTSYVQFGDESGTAANHYRGFMAYAHNGDSLRFGTASTERMRIDSSGNLLVGTTTTAAGNEGLVYFNGSSLRVTRDSDEPLNLDRLTSDGTIAAFKKDGTTIGSLASYSSTMQVGQGNAYLKFANATDTITPANGNGTDNDAALSLGKADARFSSLFLSGTSNVGVGRFTAQNVAHSAASLVLGHEGSSKSQIRAYGINAGTIGSLEFMVSAADGTGSNSMTLDSSGNLLVGKTSAGSDSVGFQVLSTGKIAATVSGDETARFNRTTSDGDIVEFRKDDTTIGSLGVSGGNNLFISGQAANHAGLTFATQSILPTTQGALNNNTVDFGQSGNGFKDLYLSGGAYLGGTAAANKLDDYEEGSFTPVMMGNTTAGTMTGTATGKYIKIGAKVTVYIRLDGVTMSGAAGSVAITGLPFAADSTGNTFAVAQWGMTSNFDFTSSDQQTAYVAGSAVYGLESTSGTSWSELVVTNATGMYLNQTITYRTTA